jgi:hypothetical protein
MITATVAASVSGRSRVNRVQLPTLVWMSMTLRRRATVDCTTSIPMPRPEMAVTC